MNIKQKDTLVIVILLFVFVLIWIGEGIYRSAVNSTISESTAEQIAPISPNFDINAIEKLKTREQIGSISATPSAIPNIKQLPVLTPTTAPVASEEGILSQ
jgi:hypothetical protein